MKNKNLELTKEKESIGIMLISENMLKKDWNNKLDKRWNFV